MPSRNEHVDVCIIGAGPAGLAAAYGLRESGLVIKVLEAADQVGGRTSCAYIGGETVNTGAMFMYVGSESEAICTEFGIASVAVSPRTFGINFSGRTVIAREDEELLAKLDLPEEASAQLRLVMHEVRREYEAYAGSAGLTENSKQLAHLSLSDHLGKLHPIVDGIVSNAVKGGSTADPGELSAQYALRYFASYLVRAANHRRYLPEGMQAMSIALSQRLQPGVLQLNTTVHAVSDAADGWYSVSTMQEGRSKGLDARQVVFAVPGPTVPELAPWLPAWKHAAISRVPTNPTVTLAIVVDSSGITEWDDIFFVATVDAPFNMLLQPRASADVVPSVSGRTCFYCYLSADAEAAAPGDDDAMTHAWLEDFYKIVPNSRGRVIDSVLTRWPRCFSYPGPGRENVLDNVRAKLGGLHFAGDYTSETAGSHGAFKEGRRVANSILSALVGGE